MLVNRGNIFIRQFLVNDYLNISLRYSHVANLSPRVWTKNSSRTGLVGIKLGMTHTWDDWGTRIPLTALHVCFLQ